MSDDFDDEGDEAVQTVQLLPDAEHPYFEDPTAQRIYAAKLVLTEIDALGEEAQKAALDLIHAVIRAIAQAPSKVAKIA